MFNGAKEKFRVMLYACSVGKLPSFSIQMVCRGYHFYGEDCFVIFIQLNQYLRLTSCINDTSFRNTPITLAHYSNTPYRDAVGEATTLDNESKKVYNKA